MTSQTRPHFEPPPEPDVEDVALDAGHYFSEDFGTTVTEQRAHEPIGARLEREEPDVGETTAGPDPGASLVPGVRVDDPSHWNVIVTVHPGGHAAASEMLERIGTLVASPYPDDVLLARVDDVFDALTSIEAALSTDADAHRAVARVLPAQHTFRCSTLDELERVTLDLVGDWLDDLAGATFHVRCRHRGDGDDIDGAEEESFLGDVVLRELDRRGTPGKIAFVDPDAVVDVETLDGQAGISLWTRDDLVSFPFLRIR